MLNSGGALQFAADGVFREGFGGCPLAMYLKLRQLPLGAPNERMLADAIVASAGARVRDFTGPGLRESILALAAVDAVVANDSGLMHIAAALGTPTIALFGPSDPRLWTPLNPLAAVIEPPDERPCPQCGKPDCGDVRHRRTAAIAPGRVLNAVREVLARAGG